MLKRVISMALIGAFLASSGTIVSNVTGKINNPCVNESYDAQFDFGGGFDSITDIDWFVSRVSDVTDANGNVFKQDSNAFVKCTYAYGGTELIKKEIILEKETFNAVYSGEYVYFSCACDEGGTDILKVRCNDISDISTVLHCDGEIEYMFLGEQSGKQYILYNLSDVNAVFAYSFETDTTSELPLEYNEHHLDFIPTTGGIVTYAYENNMYTFFNRNASVNTVNNASYYEINMEKGIIKFTVDTKVLYETFEELSNPTEAFELKEFEKEDEQPQNNIKYDYDENTKTLTITGEGRIDFDDIKAEHYDSENVIIGEGITEIGSFAFHWFKQLKNIEFPSTLKRIEMYSFYYCYRLESVELPDGLEEIGGRSFYMCNLLKDIKIPDSVQKIGAFAFEGTPWYKSLYDESGFVIAGDNVLIKYTGEAEDVIIPYGVKCVSSIFNGFDDGVLNNHKKIKSIKLPETVKYLYGAYFGYGVDIEKIVIPEGVEEIGAITFNTGVKEVVLPKSLKFIEKTAFLRLNGAKLIFSGERPEVKTYSMGERYEGDKDPDFGNIYEIYFNREYELSWLADNGEYYWKEMECKIKPINIFAKSTIKGDADGDGYITSADATKILRVVANLEYFNSDELERACVTGDSLSAADATRILRVVAGLDSIE